uniref:C2 domain-containing protein n=1 Tax=Rhabditophanes sp. KR3021 TaxID=114890 RepID=A0AC35TTA5_9BILA
MEEADEDTFIPYKVWKLERDPKCIITVEEIVSDPYNEASREFRRISIINGNSEEDDGDLLFENNHPTNSSHYNHQVCGNGNSKKHKSIEEMTIFGKPTANIQQDKMRTLQNNLSFDLSDFKNSLANESRLRVISVYDDTNHQVRITVLQGIHMPFEKSQIRVSFVGKKIFKFYTHTKTGWDPLFNQTFILDLQEEDLVDSFINFKIYTPDLLTTEDYLNVSSSDKSPSNNNKSVHFDRKAVSESVLPIKLIDIADGSETIHNLKLHAVKEGNRNSVPNIDTTQDFTKMTVGGRKRSNSATINNLKFHMDNINPLRQHSLATSIGSSNNSLENSRGSLFDRSGGGTMDSYTNSRRGSTVDESGRFCSLPMESTTNADLLVSLCYNSAQGRLVVGVEKASAVGGAWGSKAPETFVKVTALTQFHEEVGKQKTNCVKETFTPVYDATCLFEIPKTSIENHSVLIQIFTHCGLLRRKVLLGQITVGEAASSPDAQDHWDEMIQGDGITVSKWHTLIGRNGLPPTPKSNGDKSN